VGRHEARPALLVCWKVEQVALRRVVTQGLLRPDARTGRESAREDRRGL
jgi:hypothetical protein